MWIKKENDDNDDANPNTATNDVTNDKTIVTKTPGQCVFTNLTKGVVSNNDNQ